MAEDLILKDRPVAPNSSVIIPVQSSDGESWLQLSINTLISWVNQSIGVGASWLHIVNGDGTSAYVSKAFERLTTYRGEGIVIPLVPRAIDKFSNFDDFKGVVRVWIPVVIDGEEFETPFDLATMGDLPVFVSWIDADDNTVVSPLALFSAELLSKRASIKDVYGKCIDIAFDGSFQPSQLVINGKEDNIGKGDVSIAPVTIDPYTEDDNTYIILENTPEKLDVLASGTGSEIAIPVNNGTEYFTDNKAVQATINENSEQVLIDGDLYSPGQTITLLYTLSLNSWTVSATDTVDSQKYEDAIVEESSPVNIPIVSWRGLYVLPNFSDYFTATSGLFFFKNQDTKSEIGIYKIFGYFDNIDVASFEKVADYSIISTVKVKDGTERGKWFNKYNGDDISSLQFSLLTTPAFEKFRGFHNPDTVVITEGVDPRTVVVTGDLTATFQSKLVTEIVPSFVSGYISPQHPVTDIAYYLTFNGANIDWRTSFAITDVLICIKPQGCPFYLRECHDVSTPVSVHRNNHYGIGTCYESGGLISNIVIDSFTAGERRPYISELSLLDEGLKGVLAALNTNSYTRLYLSSVDTVNYETVQTDIVEVGTNNRPYYYDNTSGSWVKTLIPRITTGTSASRQRFMSVYAVGVPVILGTESQKYRFLFVQGQGFSTSLESEKQRDPGELNLGTFSSLNPEYFIFHQFIIRYVPDEGTGDWNIAYSTAIRGSKSKPVSLSGTVLGGKPIQVEGKSVVVEDWSLVSGFYEADIPDDNITANSIVQVIPGKEYATIFDDAQFVSENDSSAGSVKIYCRNIPADTIVFTINIEEKS